MYFKSVYPMNCKECLLFLESDKFRCGRTTCNDCLYKLVKKRTMDMTIEDFFKQKIKRLAYSAKTKDREFKLSSIDLINLWNKQDGLCYYTNVKMIFIDENNKDCVSVDRIDSDIDYVVGNIVLCRKIVNMMKNKFPLESFYNWCELVVKNADAS